MWRLSLVYAMPAVGVIPFVLMIPVLISIPHLFDIHLQDELNVDNSQLNNGAGPALFQRKLVGLPTPLYAELSEGVMSYKVRLFHELDGIKLYYHLSDCSKDVNITTNKNLASLFEIQTGDDYIQRGGKFSIGYRCRNTNNDDESSGSFNDNKPSFQWLGIREDNHGMHLTADDKSNKFKLAAGEITPYYMSNVI